MKGFHRNCPDVSLCGLNCALCSMHLGGYCPGCGGGAGNQACAIARCSMQKQIEFCYDCETYPCERFDGFDDYDSFVPHSCRSRDVRRVQEIGLELYLSELHQKAEIYRNLVENYNDGRRKSFYNLAVYLLKLSDLEAVIEKLPDTSDMPIKERAVAAGALLQEVATENHILLKLQKKPKSS